jgi:hypothetical protein
MAELKLFVEHEDEIFSAELGVITSVLDGYDIHGIKAWGITFDFGGSGQTTPAFRCSPDGTDPSRSNVLDAFDAYRMEELVGKNAYAIRRNGMYGYIVGISTVGSHRVVMFSNCKF